MRSHGAARLLLQTVCVTAGCLACGGASSLRPDEWRTELPRGACVVTVEHVGPTGTFPFEQHYAADGRVLSGEARRHADGGRSAWERFAYDAAGHLAEIVSYEEQPAARSDCDDEGESGCYTPARRTLTRATFTHDEAGRLSARQDDVSFYDDSAGGYRLAHRERHAQRFVYGEGGRLLAIEDDAATTRFLYEGELLARVEREADYPRRTTVEHDETGRIVRTVLESCTPTRECRATREVSYAYDEEGLLWGTETLDPTGDDHPVHVVWERAGGRVVRRTRETIYPRLEERRVRDYTYDARGRLTSLADEGHVRERRSYRGACEAVSTGPAEPSALAELGARVCVRSPVAILDTCWTP